VIEREGSDRNTFGRLSLCVRQHQILQDAKEYLMMNTSKNNRLFSPIQLGATGLKHRVVMAPLTRSRSLQPGSIPGDLMLEYYTQRTSDGGLIISEAAQLSLGTSGWQGAPGMYSDAQIDGWKTIVDAVHAKGGYIFAQLWHPGRFSHASLTGGAMPVSASVDPEYWQNPSRLISTPNGWMQPSPHRALEKGIGLHQESRGPRSSVSRSAVALTNVSSTFIARKHR